MTEIEICKDCGFGHYHNYNGVVMCASCGEKKNKPEPVAPAVRTTRKRRTTDE